MMTIDIKVKLLREMLKLEDDDMIVGLCHVIRISFNKLFNRHFTYYSGLPITLNELNIYSSSNIASMLWWFSQSSKVQVSARRIILENALEMTKNKNYISLRLTELERLKQKLYDSDVSISTTTPITINVRSIMLLRTNYIKLSNLGLFSYSLDLDDPSTELPIVDMYALINHAIIAHNQLLNLQSLE